jgi:hypothetical protein
MDLENLSQNPEQIKQLIGLLQSLLPQEEKPTKTRKTSKKNNSGQKPTKADTNKFLAMPEMIMHKEDTLKFDKKVVVQPPTPRLRSYNAIEVTCRSCGKKDKINPVLLVDSVERYKCNTCSTSAG